MQTPGGSARPSGAPGSPTLISYVSLLQKCLKSMDLPPTSATPCRSIITPDLTVRTIYIIVGIFDQTGKAHRKNCKHCYSTTKQRLKTVYQCEKCTVPLHVHCFKEGLKLLTNLKEFGLEFCFEWFDLILDMM